MLFNNSLYESRLYLSFFWFKLKQQPHMKTILSLLCMVLFLSNTSAQDSHNLDFEILENQEAKDWSVFGNGDYKITYDQSITQSGKTAAAIESTSDNVTFNALAYSIPADFGGKKIKLTGYIKTENVAGGWSGLWMRIDPQVAFDNMQSRGITGTTDWKQYEIELPLNSNAKTVVIGGILSGTGKMWLDNLEVTIDGKSLDKAPEKELTKPQLDKEFDEGSQVVFLTLDKDQIANLDILGRIWGFLKYYHPAIGEGNYNWDYELFRILPDYQNVQTNTERDALLVNWIDSLGEVKPCKSCKETPNDAILKPDLAWMDNSGLSSSLVSKLNYIQANRNQGKHYYIDMMAGVGNPEFKNENPYSEMTFPDAGFRLLALYRYWNMMQYFNPNRHLTDKNWNTVLTEYIPKFIDAKNELEYELTMVEIIGEVNDTHANLWSGNDKLQEQRGDYFPPVHVRFAENKLVVDDYFNPEMKETAGLEIGDVITEVNGKSVEDFVIENQEYYPASNQPTRLRDMSRDILRSNSETISIIYIRDGQSATKTLQLFKKEDLNYYGWYKPEKDGKSYKMLDNNIGYITLKNIKAGDVDIIRKEFKDTKGIVVDIRNYPSAFMPFLLGSFFTSNYSPFVKFTNGTINNPGEFSYGKDLSIPPKGKFYNGKVVVLVNELSQSQAEYTAMAFRAGDNTTIVGSTTAGADGNVSRIPLPGGLSTMISGIGVYYPDGTETQRIGIVPDVEVNLTVEGIKSGIDEPLEEAIEIILMDINTTQKIKD